ncbi:hypothetical protein G8B50_13510 [Enterococcus durans]|uniref:hypothetical protein n=1 Tax=Enterococcus durans TaxID=53345 RepID=UPI001883DC7B|nr:hypothetical protein [Enterococcus durans]MBE9888659.1 hypothetical protein [Enterococcus durans]
MSTTPTEKIIKKKIHAIETALETNDVEFIGKWHGTRDSAIADLVELKERMNTFQNGNS